MVTVVPLTAGSPWSAREPSGASTWILPESSWTDSLKVSVTRFGASGTMVPVPGSLATSAACALAGAAGPSRTPSSPNSTPRTAAAARGTRDRSTVMTVMLPDGVGTALGRVVVGTFDMVPDGTD